MQTQGSGNGFSVQPAVERDAASVASSAQDVSISTGKGRPAALGSRQGLLWQRQGLPARTPDCVGPLAGLPGSPLLVALGCAGSRNALGVKQAARVYVQGP
jgi:hypothetical protein